MDFERSLIGIGGTRLPMNKPEIIGPIHAAFCGSVLGKAVFPRSYGASWEYHKYFLKFIYERIHGQAILELGVNAGETAEILPRDNFYTGLDESPRLLSGARRKFRKTGFPEPRFCRGPLEDLLFRDESFDYVLCCLALARTDNPAALVREAGRTLSAGGEMIGCVPVPERSRTGKTLPEKLKREEQLGILFENNGFSFEPLEFENGALLYFLARKKTAAA